MRSLIGLLLFFLVGCGVRLAVSLAYEHSMPSDQIKAAGEAASGLAGAVRPAPMRRHEEKEPPTHHE
jgi:hypothetical protein